jgi:hypothetical protein
MTSEKRAWRPAFHSAFAIDSSISNGCRFKTFVAWMKTHGLGRKRILDTLLGATYLTAGVNSLVTINGRDIRTFGPAGPNHFDANIPIVTDRPCGRCPSR